MEADPVTLERDVGLAGVVDRVQRTVGACEHDRGAVALAVYPHRVMASRRDNRAGGNPMACRFCHQVRTADCAPGATMARNPASSPLRMSRVSAANGASGNISAGIGPTRALAATDADAVPPDGGGEEYYGQRICFRAYIASIRLSPGSSRKKGPLAA